MSAASRLILLGPPGTGKTTRLLREIELLLDQGVAPGAIAFVSFTRAACNEAKERAARLLDLDPDHDLPYFRTIHSLALRLVQDGRTVMGDAEWKTFGESCHYDFNGTPETKEEHFYAAIATDADYMRAVEQQSRLRCCSISQAMSRVPPIAGGSIIEPDDVEQFRKRLAAYKRETKSIDFTDMLELALSSTARPAVTHAFVDECQDNCELQNRLVDHWFDRPGCALTRAGDDDQAIFTFAGAAPETLVRLAKSLPVEVLSQSYRVPRSVHRLAQTIVRQNSQRIPKQYQPRDEDGVIRSVSDFRAALAHATHGSTFALVRNHMMATSLREHALDSGLLFTCEVGKQAPLQRPKTQAAFRAVRLILAGRNLPAADAVALFDAKMIPSRFDGHEILPRGLKKRIDANLAPIDRARLVDEFKLGPWLERLRALANPFDALLRLATDERQYLGRIAIRLNGGDPHKELAFELAITSMHRCKGREADTVIIHPDMAKASYREHVSGDRESENRVAYVAATRARQNLILLEPTRPEHYPYREFAR